MGAGRSSTHLRTLLQFQFVHQIRDEYNDIASRFIIIHWILFPSGTRPSSEHSNLPSNWITKLDKYTRRITTRWLGTGIGLSPVPGFQVPGRSQAPRSPVRVEIFPRCVRWCLNSHTGDDFLCPTTSFLFFEHFCPFLFSIFSPSGHSQKRLVRLWATYQIFALFSTISPSSGCIFAKLTYPMLTDVLFTSIYLHFL